MGSFKVKNCQCEFRLCEQNNESSLIP